MGQAVIMGKQSHLYEGSDPTRFATFCATAEPVGQLWAVSASFLLLAGGIENLSSGFGQNYVLFSSKFTVLASISRAGHSGSEWRSTEVDADGGPCEYLQQLGAREGGA